MTRQAQEARDSKPLWLASLPFATSLLSLVRPNRVKNRGSRERSQRVERQNGRDELLLVRVLTES